jgi:membrane protease YdiL (CAAX protease family)
MTAVPSIAEDILTRGYLFAHLKSILKPGVWIAVSAIVYWLNHIWRLNDAAAVMAYLIMLGIVLAYTVHITGALWLAFGIHWGANIVFTITHQCMEFTADNTHKSTWVLAIAWALLLLLLMAWKNFLAVQDGKENS